MFVLVALMQIERIDWLFRIHFVEFKRMLLVILRMLDFAGNTWHCIIAWVVSNQLSSGMPCHISMAAGFLSDA